MIQKRLHRYIYCILYTCIGVQLLTAQPNNGELYKQFLTEDFQQRGDRLQAIRGNVYQALLPDYSIDSLAPILIIGNMSLRYQKLLKGRVERKVQLNVSRQDSTVSVKQYAYTDTLSKKQFRFIYNQSPKELKGEAIGNFEQFVKPILLIGGSAAVVVSLFFIRSNER